MLRILHSEKGRAKLPIFVPSSRRQDQGTWSSVASVSEKQTVLGWRRDALPATEMREAGGNETAVRALLIRPEC